MIGAIFSMAVKSLAICPKTNGIYKITNQKTGRFYIGRAEGKEGFYKRWYHHRWLLRKNNHENSYLQNSYNKHGEDFFTFEILEIKDFGDPLADLEFEYIMNLDAMHFKKGFNVKNDKNAPTLPKIVRVNHPKAKEFEILDPDGYLVKGRNLNQFCEELDFSTGMMHNVITGVRQSYKGYKSINPEFNRVRESYRLLSPEKELIIFDNMREFGRRIGVGKSSIQGVLRGKAAHIKGYHLESPSPENQQKLDKFFNRKLLVNKDLSTIVAFHSIDKFSRKYQVPRLPLYDFFAGRENYLIEGYNWSIPTEEEMGRYLISKEDF
jgi:group I intron endonuclease